MILVPWFVLCVVLSCDVDARVGERDRVVVVATVDEMDVLDADLTHAPERPALLVGWLSPHEVTPVATNASTPLVDMVRARHATVVVLSRQAQNEEDVVVQATSLHESGVRIRTLSMFYEQWLGKIPLNELERVSLLFDIGEVHAVSYARVKRRPYNRVGVVWARGAGARDRRSCCSAT